VSGAVVLGLGNPLMRDDGVGLAALERLRAEWEPGPDVGFVDGGTWGMNLLPDIEDADALILLDAVNAGVEPGRPLVLEREEVPRFLGLKLSPHQIDLREVLALAELRGALPERVVVFGVQPGLLAAGTGLTPPVALAVDVLVHRVVQRLAAWGYACDPVWGAAHA